eukprot:4277124-Prymnesium_polylepis.1
MQGGAAEHCGVTRVVVVHIGTTAGRGVCGGRGGLARALGQTTRPALLRDDRGEGGEVDGWDVLAREATHPPL